ncbi:MAG: hypothetical protein GDA56_15985 [Hormoscilla sp. GM7CHS1pb]|nr:hypothetical protein [Hormoscilla sp. GM7CHS1pb]
MRDFNAELRDFNAELRCLIAESRDLIYLMALHNYGMMGKIIATLRTVPNARQRIREQVESHTVSLIESLNEFIDEAKGKLPDGCEELVVIADNLDRIVPLLDLESKRRNRTPTGRNRTPTSPSRTPTGRKVRPTVAKNGTRGDRLKYLRSNWVRTGRVGTAHQQPIPPPIYRSHIRPILGPVIWTGMQPIMRSHDVGPMGDRMNR